MNKPNDDLFWRSLTADHSDSDTAMMSPVGGTDVVSSYLNGANGVGLEGPQLTSMRNLSERFREKNALELPVMAGTRVTFLANVGALFSYDNPPDPNSMGEVVEVKVGSGRATHHENRVFVSWDDGELRAICAEHLRLAEPQAKRASAHRIRVGCSLDGILGEYMKVGTDTLVNRASKDLWAVKQDPNGFVIERLFSDDGSPLKLAGGR